MTVKAAASFNGLSTIQDFPSVERRRKGCSAQVMGVAVEAPADSPKLRAVTHQEHAKAAGVRCSRAKRGERGPCLNCGFGGQVTA